MKTKKQPHITIPEIYFTTTRYEVIDRTKGICELCDMPDRSMGYFNDDKIFIPRLPDDIPPHKHKENMNCVVPINGDWTELTLSNLWYLCCNCVKTIEAQIGKSLDFPERD